MGTSYATNVVHRPNFHYIRRTWIRIKLALCTKKGGKSINTTSRSVNLLNRANCFIGAFYWLHTVCGVARWAWFDYSSSTKPAICLYTSDHKCNGKRVENASTFHAIVLWGVRSREISSRVGWSFCGEEGEGMVMDISLVFRYFRRTRFRPLPCVSPLANKRSNGYPRWCTTSYILEILYEVYENFGGKMIEMYEFLFFLFSFF